MLEIRMRWTILIACLVVTDPLVEAEQAPSLLSEQKIVHSTWSMYVRQVLGWQYDSPVWTKGSKELNSIGQTARLNVDKNVRAVCLGEEGDFYVFFTLRSFVDAAFPNLLVQGVCSAPLAATGDPFDESAVALQSYIRYGELALTLYEDQGGGLLKIKAKIAGTTHWDPNTPKSYGTGFLRKWKPVYETIDNVKYERPHKHISAREHLAIQRDAKIEKIKVQPVGEHDVVLVYVPKSIVAGGDSITTLGIHNPTLTVQLTLNHTKELFVFKFVLIGQETIDLIKSYHPEEKDDESVRFSGFRKLFSVAGLALASDTLDLLSAVDSTLDRVIPDELAEKANEIASRKDRWVALGELAVKIARDSAMVSKLRDRLFRAP